ncbi:MAG: hypothetical protein R3F49_20420 [Planctomycetota bacterium]
MLLHEFNNQTQLLTGMRAVLELGGADALFFDRADDLARAGERARELGYVLAVLGSALGANALLSRRERRGLRLMLDLVAVAARRREVTFGCDRTVTPLLSPAALDGWQIPWVVAACAWLAVGDAEAEGRSCSGRWLIGSDGAAALELRPFRADPQRIARLCAIAPGAELEFTPGGALLILPGAWLEVEPAATG